MRMSEDVKADNGIPMGAGLPVSGGITGAGGRTGTDGERILRTTETVQLLGRQNGWTETDQRFRDRTRTDTSGYVIYGGEMTAEDATRRFF